MKPYVLVPACVFLATLLLLQFLGMGFGRSAPAVSERHLAFERSQQKTVVPALPGRSALPAGEEPKVATLWDYDLGLIAEAEVPRLRRHLEEFTAHMFSQVDKAQGKAENSGALKDLAALNWSLYLAIKQLAVEQAFEDGEYIVLDRDWYEKAKEERAIPGLLAEHGRGAHMYATSQTLTIDGEMRQVAVYFPIELKDHPNVRDAWDSWESVAKSSGEERALSFNSLPFEERKARVERHHAAVKGFSKYQAAYMEDNPGKLPPPEETRPFKDDMLPSGFVVYDTNLYTVRSIGRWMR